MKEVEHALDEFLRLAESLPFSAAFEELYLQFSELVQSNFLIRRKPWLNTFELAAIAKCVYLEGGGRITEPIQWAPVLNSYKALWRATEESKDYPDDPAVVASFILRFVYQQLAWNINPGKMQRNFDRVRGIFETNSTESSELRKSFETAAEIGFEDYLKIAHVLFGLFKKSFHIPDHALIGALEAHFSPKAVAASLRILSATRAKLRRYYESHAKAANPAEYVYEVNPLLRYPILSRQNEYWCVFPELINYTATRGLYFYISDLEGAGFQAAFSKAFEAYIFNVCEGSLGSGDVSTEDQERAIGWTTKNNDVSLFIDGAAVLFECKNSGLFSVAKRSADPQDLVADIRKNLANPEKRKGLFQLYDKIKAIREGRVSLGLQSRYKTGMELFPVVLLNDEIWFANRPEVLKNLIDSELKKSGISTFDYQIWHVDDLELLMRAVPREELLKVIREKFLDQKYRMLDLSAYLSGRYGLGDLTISMFVPPENSKAWQLLRRLAAAENSAK